MKSLLPTTSYFLRTTRARGFSLAEVVIAAAIIVTGIAGIAAAFSAYSRANTSALVQVQATLLAEEGIEAAMIMRDTSWTSTIAQDTVGTPYYVTWRSGTWATTTAVAPVDGTFYRTITFGNAYRDGSDKLAVSGTLDSNTRLVTSSVSWMNRNATSTVTLQAYVSNLFSN